MSWTSGTTPAIIGLEERGKKMCRAVHESVTVVHSAWVEGWLALNVEQLKEVVDRVQVVDVRQDDEWSAGHLERAVHIPLDRLAAERHFVDRSRPVVTVCRTGVRSQTAAELLREAGIDAESLDGGLRAWVDAGHRLVDSAGADGSVLEEVPGESMPPEFVELQGNLIEVAYGLQERFGNREPTDAEARSFMREWLEDKGTPPERIDKILGDD